MDFIEDNQRRLFIAAVDAGEEDGIPQDLRPVIANVPVYIRRRREACGVCLGKRRLAGLSGAGQKDHGFCSGQFGPEVKIKRPIHADNFDLNSRKVRTFFPLAPEKSK